MDPVSIASVVASLTGTCLSTVKRLYDLREKYKDAPVVIVAICSESTVISASLAQIQGLLLQRHDFAGIWKSHTELPMVLDQAVTGVIVIFSLLDAEIQRITAGASDPSRIRWRPRLRMLWNESQLNDLLGSIRGQQTAITLLIQLLQMNTLTEVRNMLREQGGIVRASATMTQSLRARNPTVRIANSIYDQPDQTSTRLAYDAASMVAPSELEFEFDDMVINSQAYRRVMAYAKARTKPLDSQTEHSLGDLIDLTDHATTREGGTATAALPAVFQELQDLTIHEPPARKQTVDSGGIQAAEPLSATGGLVNDTTMVVAEPEEAPTTSLMRHSRSKTPTPLVRPGHEFENSSQKRCGKCGWVLTGQFVRVPIKDEYGSSKLFHLDCFRCADCDTRISDKFFPLDDIFLCETDYFRRLDLLCSACGKALRSAYLTANDRKFHVDHFKCKAAGCHVVFGKEDSFYEHENQPYCKFHYCHMHARLCPSCDCPVLEQFVEMEWEGTLHHWHPPCYMMDKYWSIRMKPVTCGRLEHTAAGWIDKLGNPLEPGVLEQVLDSVAHDIDRIWSVASTFEATYARHLSDMVETLSSSSDYTSFIRPARAFLACTAALFHALQHVAVPHEYRREAKLLCRKTIATFILASKVFTSSQGPPRASTKSDGVVPTQELSTLVAGIAQYVMLLVGIGLRASTRSQVAGVVETQLDRFLQPLESLETGTKPELTQELDARLDTLPLVSTESYILDQTDICVSCSKPVEERCFSCQTQGERRFRHVQCLQCIACGQRGAYDLSQDGPAGRFQEWTMQCKFCGMELEEGTYVWYSTLDLYTVLLDLALERLLKILRMGGT